VYEVEILVKRVVNCVLKKCDGFKRVKVELTEMKWVDLNCLLYNGCASKKEV